MVKSNIELICDIAERIALAQAEGDSSNLLQGVAASVAEHMRADVCSIYIFDERDEQLTLRATQGLDHSAIDTVKLSLEEGLTGQAVKEMRSICVGRASKEQSYKFFPGIREEQYEAFLAVPILRGRGRIGALVVQSGKPDYFVESDVTALRAIALQLATMFESVKVLNEARLQDEQAPLVKRAVQPVERGIVRGRSASIGVAKGVSCVLDLDLEVHNQLVEQAGASQGIAEFESALACTIDQIKALQVATSEQLADVAVLIFSAHLLMLEDEQFIGRIRNLIIEGSSATQAIGKIVDEYVDMFSKSDVPMVREKVLDVKDLGNRLARNLLAEDEKNSDYQGQIVVVAELLPSDILKFSAEKVEGLVVCSGVTSHNAIICRSLQIPMVSVTREEAKQIPDGIAMLMDAGQGIIYIQPDEEVMTTYQELAAAEEALQDVSGIHEERKTACGEVVEIQANINLLSDLVPAMRFKANGVGLYRSEFPFIVRNDFPTEEEQTQIYQRLVERMEGRTVTLRTLDIGGDKMLSYYSNVTEANPFLGMRAIRFSLQNRDIFSQQLRAFLRASTRGPTQIMFPLIASVDDFLSAREIVYACMDELRAKGVAFDERISLGVMMELPSSVEVAEELAAEADFLSIGSNDLVQYMLAVDRTNEQVSNLYKAHHPAILRAINRIVTAAREAGKEVSICGDLAADVKLLPFLLGIGLRKLSVDMVHAPALERSLGKIHMAEAEKHAQELLKYGRLDQVEAVLEIE